MDVTTNPKF